MNATISSPAEGLEDWSNPVRSNALLVAARILLTELLMNGPYPGKHLDESDRSIIEGVVLRSFGEPFPRKAQPSTCTFEFPESGHGLTVAMLAACREANCCFSPGSW